MASLSLDGRVCFHANAVTPGKKIDAALQRFQSFRMREGGRWAPRLLGGDGAGTVTSRCEAAMPSRVAVAQGSACQSISLR